MVPPLGMQKIKIAISRDDVVYAATCANMVSLPNFDNQDYNVLKSVMNSVIVKEDFRPLFVGC